jgi:S1-C subfamily serine protease
VVKPGMGVGEVFGARIEGLSGNDRQMFNVENGVKIVELNDGVFKDMGLKKGTVITAINGKKVNNTEDVKAAVNYSEKSLKSIEGVTSDGRNFTYRFGY